ncbi:MAG TPA: SelB C-terminal domain-containing protein, partial [Kouleothrix sp.]|nr:SelB C-terminal domain-containing protein [Kouleothrix sp.]
EAIVRLHEYVPALAPEQERAVTRLIAAFRAAPYSPPALDLEPELAGWLAEQGHVVRVAPEIAFLPETYAEMVNWVRESIRARGSVTVAQFRDHFGSSRKYALALLEHLDERKVTRRAGEARVLY